MYRWINQAFDQFNRKSPVFVQTPWMRNLGNCAEEMYFGLLKAKRERKRVLFLFFQHPLFWKFSFRVANKELLQVESEYIAPNDSWYGRIGAWLLTLVYSLMRVVYVVWRSPKSQNILHKILPWAPALGQSDSGYVIPKIGVSTLWKPDGVHCFSRDRLEQDTWSDQFRDFIPPKLKAKKFEKAERLRVQMGVPSDDWFACLHIRESGYRMDTDAVYRNASIENHLKGIKAITDAGGWVVRLGDPTMTPFPTLDRVIDYPHTWFKSELMDIYLFSMCRFFVGPNSGPSEAVTLFKRPKIIINATEWSLAFIMTQGDLGILKHYYSRSRGRFLSVQELLNEPFSSQSWGDTSDDYLIIENTPEEIEDVIKEYLENPAGSQRSELQTAFDDGRKAQVHHWFEEEPLLSVNSDGGFAQMYRMAARSETNAGTLGRKYLQQNWIEDSMNLEKVSVEKLL